ncbi:hypothetical protein [Comamonas sp. 17RB]|uniref:hypothetical protein n=1 Tax=Comamonas sp. 17RB TaxID=3047025 RepID=UPI0024B72D6D|nr:hypothetical protein [Comamonas sp. 17RB]MDI9853995.1 hypothetical protein [Comamonas sp. 17RB]
MNNTVSDRQDFSAKKLDEIKSRLEEIQELKNIPGLTIFSAGSFSRMEASEYSDIDLFFVTKKVDDGTTNSSPRTNSIRIFGKIIELAEAMGLPQFSNDCEYLQILTTEEIIFHLGSRADDHENYFTARMLMLLEGHCLYGDVTFEEILLKIVESYFKDYPKHQEAFQPVFLLNDICRYWKTMLLNYENKRGYRNGNENGDDEGKKTKQRVKNFKLKFSRMTTCFASIAAIGSHNQSVSAADVVNMVKMTPRDRLKDVARRLPVVEQSVDKVLNEYSWFIEKTGLSTEELEREFSDEENRAKMFARANSYGDEMYSLIQAIDQALPDAKLLRFLVI